MTSLARLSRSIGTTAVLAAVALSAGLTVSVAPDVEAQAATSFQTTATSFNMLLATQNANKWKALTNSKVTQAHLDEDILWTNRVKAAALWLNNRPADIIGLQENNKKANGDRQIEDLLPLMTGFAAVQPGEESPLLYRTSVYTKVKESTFQITTKGVDGADHDRYCSWALLTHKATGRSFYAFNTHTEPGSDERAAKVRVKSYTVLIDQIKKIDPGFATPFVLTGDFNESSDATKAPYNAMQTTFPKAGITDLARTSPDISLVPGASSYNGMGWELPPGDKDAIWRYHAIRTTNYRDDYVLASAAVKGVSWEVVTGPGTRMVTASDDERYPFFADGSIPSDHNPVREVLTVS